MFVYLLIYTLNTHICGSLICPAHNSWAWELASLSTCSNFRCLSMVFKTVWITVSILFSVIYFSHHRITALEQIKYVYFCLLITVLFTPLLSFHDIERGHLANNANVFLWFLSIYHIRLIIYLFIHLFIYLFINNDLFKTTPFSWKDFLVCRIHIKKVNQTFLATMERYYSANLGRWSSKRNWLQHVC